MTLCRSCGHDRPDAICVACGVNLETGELIGDPEAIDPRGPPPPPKVWVQSPPRTTVSLLGNVFVESQRGVLGSLFGIFLLTLTLGIRLWTTIPAFVVAAFILLERARAARGSPVLDSETPVEETLKLTKADAIRSALQAGAASLFVGVPLSRGLDAASLSSLQDAGLLPFVTSLTTARVSAVGSFFVMVLLTLLLVRAARAKPGDEALRLPGAQRVRPYDFNAVGFSFIRGCLLALVMLMAAQSPWVLVPALIVLPVVVAGFASDDADDMLPWRLATALRHSGAYWRTLLLSTPLLGGLFVVLEGGLGEWTFEPNPWVAACLALFTATLAGVIAGLNAHDTSANWVRMLERDPSPADQAATWVGTPPREDAPLIDVDLDDVGDERLTLDTPERA